MQTNIYTLPELTFVAGNSQELIFKLKEQNGSDYNANYCTANFSVCNYSNKVGKPLFSITPDFISENNKYKHILHIILPSELTVNLYGKYIYQIVIMDNRGKIEIPNHGIMNITRNISIKETEAAIQNSGFITV